MVDELERKYDVKIQTTEDKVKFPDELKAEFEAMMGKKDGEEDKEESLVASDERRSALVSRIFAKSSREFSHRSSRSRVSADDIEIRGYR